jgi:hypothetical protein
MPAVPPVLLLALWGLQVVRESLYDAFYKLTDSRSQITSYVFDEARPSRPCAPRRRAACSSTACLPLAAAHGGARCCGEHAVSERAPSPLHAGPRHRAAHAVG